MNFEEDNAFSVFLPVEEQTGIWVSGERKKGKHNDKYIIFVRHLYDYLLKKYCTKNLCFEYQML